MGDMLSLGSYSHSRVPRKLTTLGLPKPTTSSFSPKPLKEAPYTYDAGDSPDNSQLNSNRNTPQLIQTHEHVHSDTKEIDMLKFSSSSPLTLISGFVSSPASAHGYLHLGQDKYDGHKDSDVGGSRSGFNEHLTLDGELRRDMRIKMKPDLIMRTELNGASDEAVLIHEATRPPFTARSINSLGDHDGSVLEHVAGAEHRDMGGLESFRLLAFDRFGPASPISGSVSTNGISGVSAVGPLFAQASGTGSHINDEDADIQVHTPLDPRTISTQSQSIDCREGGEGEVEECGLLKSLLESSDPWGLMKRKVLNLPSPAPEEIKRENREEDLTRVRECFGRRGVGYVTPPSMDALLGAIFTSGEAETNEVWECGPSHDQLEDSHEILDFGSSQHRTGLLPNSQSGYRATQLIEFFLLIRRSLSNTSISSL